MECKIKKQIIWILLLVLLTGCEKTPELTTVGMMESETGQPETDLDTEMKQAEQNTECSSECQIAVFLCGAVKAPGVYYLDPGARIYEAVEAAGGFLPEADSEWLNQADLVQDGQKLKVYTRDETSQMLPETVLVEGQGFEQDDGCIHLNSATREELMLLPGIGEAKADAILEYRESHGGFQTTEELMNISGIKEAVFSKIRDKIKV